MQESRWVNAKSFLCEDFWARATLHQRPFVSTVPQSKQWHGLMNITFYLSTNTTASNYSDMWGCRFTNPSTVDPYQQKRMHLIARLVGSKKSQYSTQRHPKYDCLRFQKKTTPLFRKDWHIVFVSLSAPPAPNTHVGPQLSYQRATSATPKQLWWGVVFLELIELGHVWSV